MLLKFKNYLNIKSVTVGLALLILAYFTLCTSVLQFNPQADYLDLYYTGIGSDQALFRYIGEMWFAGKGIPYLEIFDHKGPMLFFIHGVISLISRYPEMDIYRLVFIGFNFVTYLIGYKFIRMYGAPRWFAVIGVYLSACFMLESYSGGSCEEILLPFLMLALYLSVKYINEQKLYEGKKSMRLAFTVGLLTSCVFLIRPNNVLPMLAPFAWIVYINHKQPQHCIKIVSSATIGFITPILAFAIYFWAHGALNEFYEGLIGFSLHYSSNDDFVTRYLVAFKKYMPLFLPALLCQMAMTYFRKENGQSTLILATMLLTIASAMMGMFFLHYWWPMLAMHCLVYAQLYQVFDKLNGRRKLIYLLTGVFVSLMVSNIAGVMLQTNRTIDFVKTEKRQEQLSYEREIKQAAEYIKEQGGQDSVYSFNIPPLLFWELESVPAHRYWDFQQMWTFSNPTVCPVIVDFVQSKDAHYIVDKGDWGASYCPEYLTARDANYKQVVQFGRHIVHERKD